MQEYLKTQQFDLVTCNFLAFYCFSSLPPKPITQSQHSYPPAAAPAHQDAQIALQIYALHASQATLTS